jgi:hypothetical protein
MLKTRPGYFFLSFALLIVMILTPIILVTSTNDASVKTSIALYKNRLQSTNAGKQALQSRFDSFLASPQLALSPLGARQYEPARAIDSLADASLKYIINSQASLIPSTLDLNGNSADECVDNPSFACDDLKVFQGETIINENRFSLSQDRLAYNLVEQERQERQERDAAGENGAANENDRLAEDAAARFVPFELADENQQVQAAADLGPVQHFYYSIPALGTGNASRLECKYFSLNQELLGPLKFIQALNPNEQPKYLDPLNHPCNLNSIQAKEQIAIPLFNVNNPIDYDDLKLGIRIFSKCSSGRPVCDIDRRIDLRVQNLGRAIFSAAIIDLEDPDFLYFNENFITTSQLNTATLYQIVTPGLDANNRRGAAIAALFTPTDILANGRQTLADIIANNENDRMLVIILNFLETQLGNASLDEIEYQVLSNQAIGDNKVVAAGELKYLDRNYKLKNLSWQPEFDIDTGVVFGN